MKRKRELKVSLFHIRRVKGRLWLCASEEAAFRPETWLLHGELACSAVDTGHSESGPVFL